MPPLAHHESDPDGTDPFLVLAGMGGRARGRTFRRRLCTVFRQQFHKLLRDGCRQIGSSGVFHRRQPLRRPCFRISTGIQQSPHHPHIAVANRRQQWSYPARNSGLPLKPAGVLRGARLWPALPLSIPVVPLTSDVYSPGCVRYAVFCAVSEINILILLLNNYSLSGPEGVPIQRQPPHPRNRNLLSRNTSRIQDKVLPSPQKYADLSPLMKKQHDCAHPHDTDRKYRLC